MKDGETRSDSFVTFVGEMTIINAVSVAQKMLSDNILQINIYQSEYDNLDIHNGKGGGGRSYYAGYRFLQDFSC